MLLELKPGDPVMVVVGDRAWTGTVRRVAGEQVLVCLRHDRRQHPILGRACCWTFRIDHENAAWARGWEGPAAEALCAPLIAAALLQRSSDAIA